MKHDFAFPKLKHLRTSSRSLLDVFTQDRSIQFHTLWIRTYDTEELFLDRLRSAPCDAWSYIVHDKDVNEDGSLVMPHIHALLHFPHDARIRLTSLDKWFTQNTEVEVPIDKQACFDYQIHARNPEKYQYDETDRKTHNTSLLLSSAYQRKVISDEEKMQRNAEFIKDLRDLVPYDLAVKYGRDYIKNRQSYHAFIFENPYDFHTDVAVDEYKKIISGLELKLTLLDSCDEDFQAWNTPYIINNEQVVRRLLNSIYGCIASEHKLPNPRQLLVLYSQALQCLPIQQTDSFDSMNAFLERINEQ